MRTLKTKGSAYHTRGSQAVSDPSTNRARRCLTCEIRRVRVHSTWYGGRRGMSTLHVHITSKSAHNSLSKHSGQKIPSTIDGMRTNVRNRSWPKHTYSTGCITTCLKARVHVRLLAFVDEFSFLRTRDVPEFSLRGRGGATTGPASYRLFDDDYQLDLARPENTPMVVPHSATAGQSISSSAFRT